MEANTQQALPAQLHIDVQTDRCSSDRGCHWHTSTSARRSGRVAQVLNSQGVEHKHSSCLDEPSPLLVLRHGV